VNVVLAQISDPHLRIGAGDLGSAQALAQAVRTVAELEPAPAAVLISGDIADHASPAEYEQVRELLEPLSMPIHVLAGNHDDTGGLRAQLGAQGKPGEPLQYSARIGPLRLIACDTTLEGRDDGALGAERLAWLEAELERDLETPTLLAMHHPPLLIGLPAVDELGLAEADRAALGLLLPRHPQVKRILAGHVHRGAVGSIGGCPVFICASSYLQLALDPRPASEIALVREPPVIGLHVLVGAELISHAIPIGDHGPPFRLS
jgi:3',5'-cyclic AMP phosphodiesterase CpdA